MKIDSRFVTLIFTSIFLISSSFILSGCDLEQFGQSLQDGVNTIKTMLTASPPGSSQSQKNSRAGSKKENTAAMLAQRTKQNAEILQEVYRVVYLQVPKSTAEFGSLVDTLNQGASIEGIYNGLIHSADYRSLEKSHPGANASALQFFSEELARTELQMSSITVFPTNAAQPLSAVEQPMGTEGEIDFPAAQASKPTAPVDAVAGEKPKTEVLFRKYVHDFAGGSFFTLKRVLGDEILNLISEKSRDPKDPKALAKWYGDFAHRMTAYKVDFGLALRNNPDAAFHEGWAMSVSGDQLRWEVLNRVHRILNQMEVSK
jgi:hypothetical protein